MNTAHALPSSGPTKNEILADKISQLAAHIHAATYRFLVMVREFDEREAWAEMGARSCAHWLNWRCGINVHTAREKIRVAHALADLHKISAAFKRGQLSYSKIRALTRVANTENEDTLLNIALSGTASQLEQLVRREIRTDDETDVEARTAAAMEHREFRWHSESDGSVVFFGRLPAELAEHVINAIESTAETIPRETSPTVKTRHADALVALANRNCKGYEVTLHVSAGTSMHANSLKNTGAIPVPAAQRLCCDAAFVPASEDHEGNVLDVGRRTRKIPTAMRRALDIRDKGCCRFPGCTNTSFLHGHHIKHWANGGKTSLDNLVLLCWHHHNLVHEGGFACRAIRSQTKKELRIVFERPDGVIIPDAFRLSAATTPIESQHHDLGISPQPVPRLTAIYALMWTW
ncbi:MAG: DUF222 domain-containing protein [Gammaproteobacteria bacterium]|nr:DUF222 domain-containing protein [Gammaproteobacteria bacterium]